MDTTNIQRTSWTSKLPPTPSRTGMAGTGVFGKIGSAASKAIDAWVYTPKALKLPFETAAILYAPGAWMGAKGTLAGFTVLTETPKNLAAFLTNRPIKFFGERWQFLSLPFPKDPKLPLTDLDKKIGTFERAQPFYVNTAPPPIPADISLWAADPSAAVSNTMEKKTDQKLEVLIEKISYFSILKAIHFHCGVPESETTPLLCLVDEASRYKNPSLWNIFTNHYGSKMSWWGYLKAGFIYLCLWSWIPIIPKTVDAYFKNMLSELRINLKENGENRKKFINGLLEDADNFFEVYNGAAETYANDQARKGNLNHYRKNAIDLMLPKEELNHGKTPEELRMDFYRKLSSSIVDHFSPKERYGFLERWLNERLKMTLRNQVLPAVFANISDQGKEATKRHNIPFFLALTKTLISQISIIQGKMEEEPSDSSSLYGIRNFEALVKKFLWTIDMADCKTTEEVRTRLEKLKQPEGGIDATIRQGIQLGIQKGLAVVCDYLSKQENTEGLFANLFESLTSPLSGHLPMTDEQWAEVAIEYEGAKILLKQAGSALAKQIVQSAVEDKIRGGLDPEATERAAERIFSNHKARGQEAFEELLPLCDTIERKIDRAQEGFENLDHDFSLETSIHPELSAIASTLKGFENKERVQIAMEQDPPPPIAKLPAAEREAILRVLYPLYEGSNRIMDHVLTLQILQKQHTIHSQTLRHLRQIKEAIGKIASNQGCLEQISLAVDCVKKLETIDSKIINLPEMKEGIHTIAQALQQIEEEEHSLNALANLQPFPGTSTDMGTGLIDQLVLFVQNTPLPGFKKWKCIAEIKKNVKAAGFTAVDEQRVFELIEKMNKFNSLSKPRPDFNREIWEPLALLVNDKKTLLERNLKRAALLLERSLPRAHQSNSVEIARMESLSLKDWKEMRENSALLQADVSKLYRLIEQAKKETLLNPTAAQLGQVGGTLGFLVGLATGTVSPEAGSVLGAVSAASVANLSNLAKGKWFRFSAPVLGAGAAAGLATKYLGQAAEKAFPNMPMIPAIVGAAGASAGLEYVGAKMTKRLIQTSVDVAMPKVIELFDTAYDHLLTNDIVINGSFKIMMKQMLDLFPPKN